jgi:hypothetical protein
MGGTIWHTQRHRVLQTQSRIYNIYGWCTLALNIQLSIYTIYKANMSVAESSVVDSISLLFGLYLRHETSVESILHKTRKDYTVKKFSNIFIKSQTKSQQLIILSNWNITEFSEPCWKINHKKCTTTETQTSNPLLHSPTLFPFTTTSLIVGIKIKIIVLKSDRLYSGSWFSM